jgi:predicted regulator of Ras-like GTPase activity (Roadblock/LC7/MglB family)
MMLDRLRALRTECSGIEAALLISSDAMPLASDLSDSLEEEVLSATASTLVSAGEKVARELSRGDVDQLYLRGDDGDLVVVRVNDDAILACMVDHQAKMGMTLLEVSRCAQRLAEII